MEEYAKDRAKKFVDLETVVLGMCLGITPIVIYQSALALPVSAILTILASLAISDNWWTDSTMLIKYPPKKLITLYYNFAYLTGFILLFVWILESGKGELPLSGYALVLSVLALMDSGWCCVLLHEYPNMKNINKEDYVQTKVWILVGPMASVMFLCGFLFIHTQTFDNLTTSLLILMLWVFRRIMDVLATHAFKS
jgi:hypothetical protein